VAAKVTEQIKAVFGLASGGDDPRSTNGEGLEITLEYGVFKHVTLGLDYYNSEQIDGNADQDLLQLDVVLQF
jgi:hypothetical protein